MINVVIVDDYEPNLQLFAHVVRRVQDCQAISFTSSNEALHWLTGMDAALVISDYNMPELNGVEFLRRLRSLPGRGETPVILLRGLADKEVRNQALKHGANLFLQKPINTNEFMAHVKNLVGLYQNRRALPDETLAKERETIERLVKTMELRDPLLVRHGRFVRDCALAIARELRCSAQDLELLAHATLVHDIGKLGMPDAVLFGKDALSAQAQSIARKHAQNGSELLARAESPLLQAAERIARSHHERYDGTGYPNGLKGEAIPLFARIVAVADAFAAMTAPRPFRDAIPLGHAMDEIDRQSGLRYDPIVVSAFRKARETIAEIHRESLREAQHTRVY